MNNSRRSTLILSLFFMFILILQFARMGTLNNADQFHNILPQKPAVSSLSLPEIEPLLHILIVRDSGDQTSVRCAENLSSLLDKYHIPYKLTGPDRTAPIPSEVSCLILTNPDFGVYRNYENMFAYVQNGGSVLFAAPPLVNSAFQSLSGSLGIIEYTNGIYSDYFMDRKGVVGAPETKYLFEDMVLCSSSVRLRSVCEVYLENEFGNPILWRLGFGSGNLYVANSNVISNLTGRGVVSAILAEIAGQSLLYPTYGIVTSALESFPGPSITGDYQLFLDYNMNYDTFAKSVFWVDMLKLTNDYGIIHTLSYVQSYDSNTAAPFGEGSLLSTGLLTYGGETLSNGGEIAYHGYNYRPFALKGELTGGGWFIPWGSLEDIQASVKISNRFYRESFPSYTIRCYFPPEGRMSQTVLQHLHEIMPGITTLCIPYHNNFGDQLYGDFRENEYGFFQYSITSGVEGVRWNTNNSLLSLGILSQSIDIPYAVTINRVEWEYMIAELNDIYTDLFKQYPFMSPMKISDAVEHIRWYENMDFVYREDDTGMDIMIDGYFFGMSFMLRTKQGVPAFGDGFTAHKVQPGVYTVRPSCQQFRIEWVN